MGLTSYEETVANLREAYAILCGGAENNVGLSAYSAFRCQCAVKDALSLLEGQQFLKVDKDWLPESFAKKMVEACAHHYEEQDHVAADDLMCQLLTVLGYADAVQIFDDTPKWYS